MLQCPAALVLCLRPAGVVGRCIASTINTASDSGYSLSPSFAAPQDFPLRDSVPVGNAPAVYPFKWDPLTISIIGNELADWRASHACTPLSHTKEPKARMHGQVVRLYMHVLEAHIRLDAGAVLLVNGAFVACCLRIICLRIFWRNSQSSAPSAAPAAADVPQAEAVRGGAGPDAGNGAAHISMTAVIQPNDEVCASSKVFPSGEFTYKPFLLLIICTRTKSCVTANLILSAFQSRHWPCAQASHVIDATPALHRLQQRKDKTCIL